MMLGAHRATLKRINLTLRRKGFKLAKQNVSLKIKPNTMDNVTLLPVFFIL